MTNRKTGMYRGKCPACGKQTQAHVEDQGIGAYEFWGARGIHHDYVIVSNCCEEVMPDVDFEDVDIDPEPDVFERERRRRC